MPGQLTTKITELTTARLNQTKVVEGPTENYTGFEIL